MKNVSKLILLVFVLISFNCKAQRINDTSTARILSRGNTNKVKTIIQELNY
jgi:hypothetical protein